MKKLRLSTGINLHSDDRSDFEKFVRDGLAFNKKMGFEAGDFALDWHVNLSSDTSWQPYIESTLRASEETGIRFELCHLPFSSRLCNDLDFVPIFNEQMHRAIDAAALLGVDYAVMHPNTTTLTMDKYDPQATRDSVLSHLSPFVEHAARVGVNVVVENMRIVPGAKYSYRYCQSPEDLCDIADTLGIGICWDFGHANISCPSQSNSLKHIGKRLKVLHVNDNNGIDDEHLPPFLGNVDWRDAMHGLALAEFDGLFNYELSVSRIPVSAREAYAKYIVDAANILMSYIE